MTPLEPRGDKLRVAIDRQTAFVRVVGRGTFKISTGLKRFGIAAIELDCRRFVVDLADCVSMDSTFMGVLVGVAFNMRRNGQGEIHLVNLSPRLELVLGTLGLDQVMLVHMEGSTPPEFEDVLEQAEFDETDTESETPRDRVETMIGAHESLVEADPDNSPKFKDVLSFLREDLRKKDASSSTV